MSAGDPIAAARAALLELLQTAAAWREVRRVRRSLPAKYRAAIPDPDAGLARVKGILRELAGKGAIKVGKVPGIDGYGAFPVAIVAVAAGVALVAGAAAVVVAMIPRIQQESRTSKRALAAAQQQRQLFSLEAQQAAQLGPEQARSLAMQRAQDAAALMTLPTLAAELEESAAAGTGGLPAWMVPAGIIAGAGLVAFLFLRK